MSADPEGRLRQAEESLRLFTAAVDTIPLGVTITDTAGKIVYANAAEAAMHGYPVEELIGRDARVFSPNRLWRPMSKEQVREMRRWRRESVNVAQDGRLIHVLLTSNAVKDDGGEPVAVVTVSEEITERKSAIEALRQSEERYEIAARVVSDGLWEWDLRSKEMTFSARWKEMLGYTAFEIGNDPEEWWSRVHPDDLDSLKMVIADHIAGLDPLFESEHRLRHRDGSYRWFAWRGLAVMNAEGIAYRLAGSLTDITARKVAEERPRQSAFYDEVTHLPNRALLVDRLTRCINRAKRRSDYEFAMLLDDVGSVEDATRVAERIQHELLQSFNLAGHEVFVSASIGISSSSAGYSYERPEELLRDADTAMYRAKAGGKSRHEHFDASMHARAVSLLQMENDLRRAVERSEFEVHYQPIVSLKSGRISGFEALIRWRHPERGLISPEDFIPLAEETGLIVPIGSWVLRESCRQMRTLASHLPEGGLLSVSVNLSAKQFRDRNLIDQIGRTLREVDFEGSRLKLEITESVIMENSEAATAMLHALRALNVQLHIDDFGTGYSSLSYLHRFPIDSLKIDRSFVSRMGADDHFVRTIVQLAHSLDMEVMAEGVETVEQLAQLRALRCDSGQGHFFSRPVPGQEAYELVASGPSW
jgi:PAS domain S-box-containing protein